MNNTIEKKSYRAYRLGNIIRRATMMLLTTQLCAVAASAQHVTLEQAKQIALQFIQTNQIGAGIQHRAPAQSSLSASVVFDAIDQTGQPFLYAVNVDQQGGYVLVSGDERFSDVLGYSLNGSFDEQNMPDNMRAWVQGYIDEMKYLDSIGYQPALSTSQTTGTKVNINPLVTTKWNQFSPYNDLCPIDEGSHSATGCVATSMAQIVNYHMQKYNNPTAITSAMEEYTTRTRQITVPGVAAGTPLPNKNDLLDTYNNSETDAQKNAVATLMLYCGVSIQMNYTKNWAEAYTWAVPNALINHFGFDSTTRFIKRSDFTYSDWYDVIYNELAASRPVLFSGNSPSAGGHAFLIDGFNSSNGLFHVNWGWGGFLNDYFALSVLSPGDNSVISVNTSQDGYSMGQQAVVGIQIGSGQSSDTPVFLETSNLRASGQDVIYQAFNWTMGTYNFYMGIGIMDNAGVITQIGDLTWYYLGPNYGSWGHQVTVPTNLDFANQTKKIVPINKVIDTDTWYTGINTDIYYYTAAYNAQGVPTLTVHPVVSFQNNGFILPDNMYVNDAQSIKVSLTNTGDEFYGVAYLFASTTQDKGQCAAYLGVTALENSNQTLIFDWTPQTTGIYHLWVSTDDQGANVIATTDATVTSKTDLPETEETIRQSNDWYTIAGRHLNNYPSQPGIYINRGKTILVK